jgi:hypothetical protein
MPFTASKIATCTMAASRPCAGSEGIGFLIADSSVAFQSVTGSAETLHVAALNSIAPTTNGRSSDKIEDGAFIVGKYHSPKRNFPTKRAKHSVLKRTGDDQLTDTSTGFFHLARLDFTSQIRPVSRNSQVTLQSYLTNFPQPIPPFIKASPARRRSPRVRS